ncbi:MAG: lactate utilization protein C [Granulosicoccus sp.]
MSSRDVVLRRISLALRPDAQDNSPVSLAEQPAVVADRLAARACSTLPNVPGDLVETAIIKMEAVGISVVRLQSDKESVEAVRWYLQSIDIADEPPGSVTVAPALASLAWPGGYTVGPASGLEAVSVTACVAAVAETGSVVTFSSPTAPANLNFLPETHIIVLYESQMVKHVEDAFALVRKLDVVPRTVNFVTGPSRTADIEQTLEIGAHGPRRMHVLLVAGQPPENRNFE